MSAMKGKAHTFGDNLNTDYVISGKYKFKTLDMNELAKHVMEDIRPGFYDEIKKGDFVVAGENLGAGSSREQAPWSSRPRASGRWWRDRSPASSTATASMSASRSWRSILQASRRGRTPSGHRRRSG